MFKLALPIALAAAAASFAHTNVQDPVPASAKAAPAIAWSGDMIAAVSVRDVKASVKWYQEVLGCSLELDLSEMGWCEVTTPTKDFLIGLGQPEPGEKLETNGGGLISFGVRDIEAVRKVLAAKKVEMEEIIEIPQTVKLLKFRDPDGNNLMLHQELN